MNWHLITGEYPPQPGGVSDYTRLLATELADAGQSVTVWCPPADGPTSDGERVAIRRELGAFRVNDLRRVDKLLDAEPAPRHLLVQWVPHAFGRRALNFPFCRWLRRRALRHGDRLELIVHEAFLGYDGSWRQRIAASIQRIMVRTLLSAAEKVWVTIPAWEALLRPYAPLQLPIQWLPVPSAIPACASPADAECVRSRLLGGQKYLLGHFGTYGPHVALELRAVVAELLETIPDANVLLLGRGGERFREMFDCGVTEARRLIAPGEQSAADLSLHLAACDLFVQPHEAGISSRNSSLMACLAHGRPVVATAGRLTEPIWKNSNAIALVGEHDATAMGATIGQLLADGERRSALARAAVKLYQDQFDVRHLLRRLLGEQARTPQHAHRHSDPLSA